VTDFQTLFDEYLQTGFGPANSQNARTVVEATVKVRRCPESLSPTGKWDADGYEESTRQWKEWLRFPSGSQNERRACGSQPLDGALVSGSRPLNRYERLFLAWRNTKEPERSKGFTSALERSYAFFLILQQRTRINDPRLQELIEDCTAGGENLHYGPVLHKIVLENVRSIAWRYPPKFYSPEFYSSNEAWNEDGYDMLRSNVIVEKLQQKHQLEYLLLQNDDMSGFLRGLKTQIKRQLGDQVEKNLAYLLYKQIERLLKDGRFSCYTERSARRQKSDSFQWGLSGWEDPLPYGGANLDAEAADLKITLTQLKKSTKEPPKVFPDEQLISFLVALFTKIQATLTLVQLSDVVRTYTGFQQWAETFVSLDDSFSQNHEEDERTHHDTTPNLEPSAEEQVIITDSARQIFAQLPNKRRRVLALKANGCTLEEIKRTLGIPTATADAQLKKLKVQIKRLANTREQEMAIRRVLVNLCQVVHAVFERLDQRERAALARYDTSQSLEAVTKQLGAPGNQEVSQIKKITDLICDYLGDLAAHEDLRAVCWKALLETCQAEIEGHRPSPEG